MSFSDLVNGVLAISPNQLSAVSNDPSNVGSIVNRAYRRVLRFRNWVDITRVTAVGNVSPISGPYLAGSVYLTNGSPLVQGTTLNWGPSYVGLFLYIDGYPLYRVASVQGPKDLTLTYPWEDVTTPGASPLSCEFRQTRLTMPADCEKVLAIRLPALQWNLSIDGGGEYAVPNINDPGRTITGPPLIAMDMGTSDSPSGNQEFELWPLPDQAYSYQVTYRRIAPILVDAGDVPVLREDMILAAAQGDACRTLFGRTGDNNWMTLAQSYDNQYLEMRNSEARRDQRRARPESRGFLTRDDMPTALDPGWIQAYRTYAQMNLTRVA